MTRSVIFYISILLLCFTFINVFAQETNNISNKPKNKNASSKNKIYRRAATGDKVIIKDATGNTLIQINDEGTFGSITIPDSIGPPPATTNKLYNVNGTLNFNGTALGATGATNINGLSDAKTAGNSVYLGNRAGMNDVETTNGNTAVGISTLYANTTGNFNTATGYLALSSNTTGSSNVANGKQALYFNTSGSLNTAIGDSALYSNTDGNNNIAIGNLSLSKNISGKGNTAAGNSALYSTTGNRNTALGSFALLANGGNRGVAVGYQSQQYTNNVITQRTNYNTSVGYQSLRGNNSSVNLGNYNSAFGYQALYTNRIGNHNTAIGDSALYSNIYGNNNIAIGNLSLYLNTSGYGNTATGKSALYSNTGGYSNTAIGNSALYSNKNGYNNIAIGGLSLYSNISGNSNTANGYEALYLNTSGNSNTVIGNSALYWNKSGNRNTAIGGFALNNNHGSRGVAVGYQSQQYQNNIVSSSINYNTSVGYQSLRGSNTSPNDGNSNSAFGYQALYSNYSGNGNVAIGYQAGYNETGSNKLYIANSNTSTPLIWGNFSTNNAKINGNLTVTGTFSNPSDIRFKKNIKPLINTLEKVKKINGVTFNWRKEKYPDRIFSKGLQIGVIAQELEKVYPELVVTDEKGFKSVEYTKLTAVLVEAVKEQNAEFRKQNAELRTENVQLRKEITQIKTELERNQILVKNVLNYFKINKENMNIKISKK